jgi:hypothetical protein
VNLVDGDCKDVVSLLNDDCDVVTELLVTSKINFASGSFVVVESHTKPGVILPSSVNDGRTLRCKRKRNAFDASEDVLSINDKTNLIDGFVSMIFNVNGLKEL